MNSLALMKCPFCAELIQPDAIKCRYCGESLSPRGQHKSATFAKGVKRDHVAYIDTDGDKDALLDLILKAIRDTSDYRLVSVDRESGLIKFEKFGFSLFSATGEDITASIVSTDSGTSARFNANTKPGGLMHYSQGVDATGHVSRLLSHIKLQFHPA